MALTADPADQEALLRLQELDSTMQRLDARVSRMPEEAALGAALAEGDRIRSEAAKQTGALEDATMELRRTQADVSVVEARIARDRERLAASSSVKDIQGLEQELAALATRQSDLEDIQLAVMETVEQREAELNASRDALAENEAASADARAMRDAARELLGTEREQARLARDGIADGLPAELVALYEKQRARYGIGASLLRAGVSVAAGVALNGSDLRAVRAAAPDAVLLCPESQAILVRTAESGL